MKQSLSIKQNHLLPLCIILFYMPVHTSIAQENLEQGKLFTTAYEREYLDSLRRSLLRDTASTVFDIENIPPPLIEDSTEEAVQEETILYSLGGIIERTDDNYSLWLNNNLLSHDQLPDNLSIEKSDSGLRLRIQHNGQIFLLKTGQTLNLNNGEILESFQIPALPQDPENDSG